jgi:acylglycerol lipase
MATIRSKDGTSLYYEKHITSQKQKGLILLVHGFAEHCQRYADMITWLNGLGFSVYCFDYRGHGRSAGKRGYIDHFEQYLDDLQTMRTLIETENPTEQYFIFSHSNGGLITLNQVVQNQDRVKGLVFSSPFFGFEIKVSMIKAILGKGLSKFVPTLQLPTDLDPKTVSHDPKVIEGYQTDPLIFKIATARWFTETIKAHARCEDAVKQLKVPVLFQLAGDDKIASTAESKRLFTLLGSEDQQIEVYEGLFHEIWFELERAKVYEQLRKWLENHVGHA